MACVRLANVIDYAAGSSWLHMKCLHCLAYTERRSQAKQCCCLQFAGSALGLDQVPHVVLSPMIGIVGKALKALTPW
jgi:hypothetical protein